jgi:hypothetical protein
MFCNQRRNKKVQILNYVTTLGNAVFCRAGYLNLSTLNFDLLLLFLNTQTFQHFQKIY